jgi:hypothetical protein
MHVFSVAMLVQYYCVSIFDTQNYTKEFIKNYGYYLLIILPMIVFFRLLDDHYRDVDFPWCVVHSLVKDPLYFFTFFLWIWVSLIFSSIRVVLATQHVYKTTTQTMAWSFFSSVGFYAIIALINWIPTSTMSILYSNPEDDQTTVSRLIDYFPFYVCGILYAIIFFRDRERLEKCEEYQKKTTGSKSFAADSLGSDTVVHFRKDTIMEMLDERESSNSIGGLNPMLALELLRNHALPESPSVTKKKGKEKVVGSG